MSSVVTGSIIQVGNYWLPDPSEMEWGLYDVSAADTGRTEDALMHKNRIAQKRKIKLSWHNISQSVASYILDKVNPEYISVYYPDMLTNSNQVRTFYVGDRSAPAVIWWNNKKIVANLTLDLIER